MTSTPPRTAGVPARHARALAAIRRSSELSRPAGTDLTLDSLPGRDLDADELLELAADIAGKPDLWAADVAFDDDDRHYVSLYRDAHVDVWVLCWTPVNDTGWHDHDISSGAVAVAFGTLVEHNLSVGVHDVTTEVRAGTGFSFGPEHIHRLTGLEPGSVSVHTYSPPLWRMGQYAVTDGGVLKRKSVSYADELRPIDNL